MKTYFYWPLLIGLLACGTKHSGHDDGTPPVTTDKTPESNSGGNPGTPGDTSYGEKNPSQKPDVLLASCLGSEKNSSWAFVFNTTKASDCTSAITQWGQLTSLDLTSLSPDQVKLLPAMKQPADITWHLKTLTNDGLSALKNFAPMTSLDVSGTSLQSCENLDSVPATQVVLSQNGIARCDLTLNAATHSVVLGANTDLKDLTISKAPYLESLVLRQTALSSLTIRDGQSLRDIQIVNFQNLKELTLENLPLLDILILKHNAQLSTLTLKNLPALRQLDAPENALQKISLVQTPKLAVLQVGRNQLAAPSDLVGDLSSVSILNAKDNKLDKSTICSLKPRVGKTTRVLLAPKELATYFTANCL